MSNKDLGRGVGENFIPAWLSLLKVVPGQCLLERELRAALGWPSLQNADLSSSKTREEPWPRLLTSLNRTYLLTLSYTYQKDKEITVFPICSRKEQEGFIGAAQPTSPILRQNDTLTKWCTVPNPKDCSTIELPFVNKDFKMKVRSELLLNQWSSPSLSYI